MMDERKSGEDLARFLKEEMGSAASIENPRWLSGGASKESIAFDLVSSPSGARERLLLRRARQEGGNALPLKDEAALLRFLYQKDIAVPKVRHVLKGGGAHGGYVMEWVEGETIARRILTRDAYSAARERMTAQCADVLARIHAFTPDELPFLPHSQPEAELKRYEEIHHAIARPSPIFALALRWLKTRLPQDRKPRLVHGDFRNGNFIVGEEGLRAVLDWELAHFGDPLEDLAWITVASWRFGVHEKIVGGFGDLSEWLSSYEAASGVAIDRERFHFWRVLGTLKWGVMCEMMAARNEAGALEQAAIGRRVSETEINLLNILAPRRSDV